MHPFDRALALRALGHSAVVTVLAVAVVVTTDESYSTFGMRLARLCAFAPGLVAIGCTAALAQARARGELTALAALGATPWRATLGASLGGWLLGALASILVVTPLADPAALFPSVANADAWIRDGADLVEPLSGVRVAPSGALSLIGSGEGPGAVARPGAWAALLAIAPLALVVPAWVSAPLRPAYRALVASLTLAAAVGLLHAVAAGRITAGWLCMASLPLGFQALVGHRRGARPA